MPDTEEEVITLKLTPSQARELEGWLEDDAEQMLQDHGVWLKDSNAEWLPPQTADVLLQLYDALGWQNVPEDTRARIAEGKTKWSEHYGESRPYEGGNRRA